MTILQKELNNWVTENGGEVLAITNPHELARFRAEGGVHVIYTGKKGLSYSSGDTRDIIKAFQNNNSRKLSVRPTKYNKSKKDVQRLIKRDGSDCFFCCRPFTEVDPATLEHLVARRHGGPDHMSNYVLAHEDCNQSADTLSVAEKFNIRLEALGEGRLNGSQHR